MDGKWSKFSEQELSSLKNKDDLVTQVVPKYGLEKSQAQRDVDAPDERPSTQGPCRGRTPAAWIT
jgi:hypothetical protein